MDGPFPRNSNSTNRWLPLTSPHRGPATVTEHQTLQENPAIPLSQRPQFLAMKTAPAKTFEMLSEMRLLPPVKETHPQTPTNQTQPLTPPVTPQKLGTIRSSVSADAAGSLESIHSIGEILGARPADGLGIVIEKGPMGELPITPRAYTKDYQLGYSSNGREEYGRGAWSVVYRAFEIDKKAISPPIPREQLPPSPPVSPFNSWAPAIGMIVAVKVPSRRDARKILHKEACVLTYLHSQSTDQSFLIPFHGFHSAEDALVLGAVPQSLESYVKGARKSVISTSTMFDPVVGAEEWANMATYLIDGLAFLHGARCVHGDIKPANILLQLSDTGTFKPLYCDFSSSHILPQSATSGKEIEEVSAVTTDYTSPELLEAFYHRNNDRAVATFPSDVFALAVTLLYAVVGESPYAVAKIEMQKVGMARQGAPINFARQGEQASRIMKGRAVDRALNGAVEKDPGKRLPVDAWTAEVKDALADWKEGGWIRGG